MQFGNWRMLCSNNNIGTIPSWCKSRISSFMIMCNYFKRRNIYGCWFLALVQWNYAFVGTLRCYQPNYFKSSWKFTTRWDLRIWQSLEIVNESRSWRAHRQRCQWHSFPIDTPMCSVWSLIWIIFHESWNTTWNLEFNV